MNIKRLFTVPEIIEQFDSGEYSAELLLQHAMKYMKTNNEKRFEAAKAAIKDERIKALGEAMQGVWNDYCADAGCVPTCIQIHGPRTTRVEADFMESDFALAVFDSLPPNFFNADALLAELARTEPAVKESFTPDSDRCSTCDGSGAVDS